MWALLARTQLDQLFYSERKRTTMYYKIKTQLLGAALCGCVIAVLLFTPNFSTSAGIVSGLTVGSAVAFAEERPVHPGYPKYFDNVGRIERISRSEVVISDGLFRLSPTASYHTPGRSNASRSRFHSGDLVGCLLNADGEVESIWLIRARGR